MPVLKNHRYQEFEHSVPKDDFRGVPLQQFPWLLQEHTVSTAEGQLKWDVTVLCLSASPSGFGNKLNLEFQTTAILQTDSARRLLRLDSEQNRVAALFADAGLGIKEEINQTFEGKLDETAQYSKSCLKNFIIHLNDTWTIDRVHDQLLQQLRQASPGGFGHPSGSLLFTASRGARQGG
jgi:hypothetical protein